MIRKFLGLNSSEQFDEIIRKLDFLKQETEKSVEMAGQAHNNVTTIRNDMKVLYSSLEQDIKNVKMNVKSIKPILKVEDKEAVDFIKGILSKHDHSIKTQQTFLESKMYELASLEKEIQAMTEQAQEALLNSERTSLKINNVLNGLGLTEANSLQDKNVDLELKKLLKTVESGKTQTL